MAKPKQINLTEDGVITQDALLAYAEGRLSDNERKEMDKLLSNDPFANDALEGMRQTANPGSINTAVTSINVKLLEQSGIRERKKKGIEIHWSTYAYAALILGVLVGIGFIMIYFLSGNNHNNIAEQKPIKAIEQNQPEPAKITTKDTLQQKLKPQITDSLTTNAPIIASNNKPDSLKQKTAILASNTEKDNIAQNSTKVAAPASYTTTVGGQVAAQLGVARTYFEAGNYIEAEKKYNEVLASDPNNTDALYFGGVASFLNGSKGLGEANFDKLAKTTYYTEGVKWYKANVLIKKGRKEEAKQLLRDLINTNTVFKERAVKQYEELYSK